MAVACALAIFSGKIIFNRAMPERLRTLRHCIFTGRSWERTLSVIAVRCQLPRRGNFFAAAGRFLIAPNTLATNVTAWLSLRGKTSPAPGEDVTVGDKRGNLARERLRGRARLTGAAPHPALRATFPRRVKASAAVEKFPAKAQTFRARQFRPLRRSRASSPKGGAKPLSSLLKY